MSDMNHTFANFRRVKGTANALGAFKALADGERPFLLCYGGVGNGKTHLLEAAAIRLNEMGKHGRLWVFADFLSWLRRLMGEKLEDVDTIIERYQSNRAYLFFDDVGMEYGTPWEESVLERIINGRYRSRGITALVTNKDLDQVDDKGRRCIPERVVSRFFDPDIGVVVLNEAEDYRKRVAK